MKRKNNTIIVNKFIILVIILSFFCAAGKLIYVTLSKNVDGMNLTEFANSRNTYKENIYAKRGTIYDVNGDALAQTVNSYTVIAYLAKSRTTDESNPQHVVDKEMTANKLTEILGYSEEYILKLLNSENLYQIELKRGISELTKDEIKALDLPGIDFVETNKRWYQMGNFASYIIGYAQTDDNGKINGMMGIEAYFNDELTGEDGYTEYQKDAYGYKMPQTDPIVVEAEEGNDVYLTIDNNIQMFVENGIKKLTDENDMSWIVFTVMDAKTGAIVASSSYPNFNLNTLEIEDYLNPLVSYQYEPGSTMKIFSFMSAMENGIYDGSKTYQSGTIQVDDALIKDFNEVGWGVISYDQGFSNSSNVAATNLALALGNDKLRKTYEDLGFGSKTGIELPGEYSGQINFKYRSELATASFGQGITTTPIQNLKALTALTNDGMVLKPYIVDKIVNSNGEIVYQGGRKEENKACSKETAEKLLSLMYDTVHDGITDAPYFNANNVSVAGKTGTAQIPSQNGGYLTGKYDYIKSFSGVFPTEEPQYVFYVSVKQIIGSFKSVATMSKEIIEEIAKYKNITDAVEKIDNTKVILLDNLISTDIEETKEKLEKAGLNPIIIGTGKYVINQYPLKGTNVHINDNIFLVTNVNEITMPNVKGWSSSDIITFCNIIGLKYKLNGYGYVVETSINTGDIIDVNGTIEINLSKDI